MTKVKQGGLFGGPQEPLKGVGETPEPVSDSYDPEFGTRTLKTIILDS
jgi:hypothetical protein